MTQLEGNIQPSSVARLKDLLHLIARNPSLDHVAPAILSEARIVAKADAGFYLVFHEPHALYLVGLHEEDLPPLDVLEEFSMDLSAEMHLSADLPEPLIQQYRGWLLVPIFHDRETVAVMALLSKQGQIEVDESEIDLLISLMDGMTISTYHDKVNARHQKLMDNQNEFVRIVSHDLRSPLTSMQGFASMLESQMVGDLNEKQAHFIERILAGVTQMTSLVDNIQDAGRYDPETGFYEMERTAVDLIDMVNRIKETHLLPAEKQELTLSVDTADNVPIVYVDANMIERSVTNLVDNAIKYTPNGGHVELAVRREGDHLRILVTDNGYGISEDNRRKLFTRHFRIRRQEHKRVKGSGLGLFIVQSVARRHGGDAYVFSKEGEGSTFEIRIPLRGANIGRSVQNNRAID